MTTGLVIHNSVYIGAGEDDRMYVDGNGQLRERKLGYDELYPGHIPTSTLQKVLLSIGSAGMSLLDPSRDGKFSKFCFDINSCSFSLISQKRQNIIRGIDVTTVFENYLGRGQKGF